MNVTREDVEKVVADLFAAGGGRKATRLVLVEETLPGAARIEGATNLGGWGEEAMANRVWALLLRCAAPGTGRHGARFEG